MNWGVNGHATGTICAYEPAPLGAWADEAIDSIKDRGDNSPIGEITVEGQLEGKGHLKLNFSLSQDVARSRLGSIFTETPVEFLNSATHTLYLNPPLYTDKGWQTLNFDESGDESEDESNKTQNIPLAKSKLRMSFMEFPEISQSSLRGEEMTLRKGRHGKMKLSLETLAKMTPDHAFTFFSKHPVDVDIVRGFIWVVYEPSKRDEIARFLAGMPGAHISKTSQPSCGVPYVQDGITPRTTIRSPKAASRL
jgi:hypothetical protein